MKVSDELNFLASLLPQPLYIVGGYVRNSLLNIEAGDVDLCSALTPQQVQTALEGSFFKLDTASSRLGTILIKGKNVYEYTTFRTDSYPTNSGCHTPQSVCFTTDIKADSMRRDFCANAVYYDIKNQQIVDILGGVEDIKKHILRGTHSDVFKQDALRILRLVRLSCELHFDIDLQTLAECKKQVNKLSDISCERIAEEFNKILLSDCKYPQLPYMPMHFEGIKLLIATGAMRFIVPELLQGEGVLQNAKYHKFDVLQHTLQAFKASDSSVRLAVLLHDIAKPFALKKDGNMFLHAVYGRQISREILQRLKYPNAVIAEVSELVGLHMYDIEANAKDKKLKEFVRENFAIIPKLILVKIADKIGAGMDGESESANRMSKIYNYFLQNNLPTEIKDLKINGEDCLQLGLQGAKIKQALTQILDATAQESIKNNRDEQLIYLKKIAKKG
ncbi:MAG: HD domain-containing protein [Clostridia bacterium]